MMVKLQDETIAAHEDEQQLNEGKINVQQKKHEVQKLLINQASPTPSSSSSPSHEFTFTISLHPSTTAADKTSTSPPNLPPFTATIDISPADEIFFHDQLLPLLSHQHMISTSSSRSSTNSVNSFTFTLKDELLHDHKDIINSNNVNKDDEDVWHREHNHVLERKVRGKSRSFSRIFPRWLKDHHSSDHHDHEKKDVYDDQKEKNRKSKFDVMKRYIRLVKPFIPFRHRKTGNYHEIVRQSASFNSISGRLKVRKKKGLMVRGRRNDFSSAPVSIRTSPTNSGLLVGAGNLTHINKKDSANEELNAAVQAAIAHCKKSIAKQGEKEQEKAAT